MKRLIDLTVEDITATPVWRYEGGSEAAALVVPSARNSLSQTDEEVYLAATEFVLADSSRHLGFCFPVDDSGIDYLQPVIVTRGGHIRFWFDGPVAQEVLANQWNLLGKREDEIFPMQFRCFVPVDGRTVTGVVSSVETSSDISRTADFCPPSSLQAGTRVASHSRAAETSVLPPRPTRAGVVEKRTAPRHTVEMMVEFDGEESRATGVTGDVSRIGMFVRTARVPTTGPLLHLTVHLPGGRKLLLRGRVVRSAVVPEPSRVPNRSGFGFRLTGESADYEEFLSRLRDTSK